MTVESSHLADRVVIVTGAAGGFGRLVSSRLVARGSHVVATDVDAAGLDDLVASLADGPGSAMAVVGDVTDLTSVQAVVDAAVERHGRVDAIVNNAGTMPLAFFSDHDAAAGAWDRCIDINIKGVLHGMIAVHDQMMAQGHGHVVNISSIYGNRHTKGSAVYSATKAAVNVMSESFRVECQGAIKVTIVKPTGVPATGLAGSVVNFEAASGILGEHAEEYGATLGEVFGGTASPELSDPESPKYAVLSPDYIADAVVYALDQPWGVSIGDITVRATGDRYIL